MLNSATSQIRSAHTYPSAHSGYSLPAQHMPFRPASTQQDTARPQAMPQVQAIPQHAPFNPAQPKQHLQTQPHSLPPASQHSIPSLPQRAANAPTHSHRAASPPPVHAAAAPVTITSASPSNGPRKRSRPSNSTSSLFLTSTLDRPDLDGLVMSVSTMLHCQMMRDEDATEKKKRMFPFFLEEYYTGKVNKVIPDPETIYQFLKEVFDVGEFHSECAIILLVYINRLIGLIDMPLTARNWKPVTIIALILSQKVWDDNPLANADFSVLYPVLNLKQINSLEVKFLLLLQYKLTVSASLYARYYFELRTICEGEWNRFTLKPLTKKQSEKLEIRSAAFASKAQANAVQAKKSKPRSLTVEDFCATKTVSCVLN